MSRPHRLAVVALTACTLAIPACASDGSSATPGENTTSASTTPASTATLAPTTTLTPADAERAAYQHKDWRALAESWYRRLAVLYEQPNPAEVAHVFRTNTGTYSTQLKSITDLARKGWRMDFSTPLGVEIKEVRYSGPGSLDGDVRLTVDSTLLPGRVLDRNGKVVDEMNNPISGFRDSLALTPDAEEGYVAYDFFALVDPRKQRR